MKKYLQDFYEYHPFIVWGLSSTCAFVFCNSMFVNVISAYLPSVIFITGVLAISAFAWFVKLLTEF